MRATPYLFTVLFCLMFATSANAQESLWRACVDAPNATNLDVNDCLSGKLKAEQGALDAFMNEQLAAARDTDASMRADEPDSMFAVQEAKLKASHAAFTAYRDADCDRVYYGYTGGSGANTANLICQLEHTHERIRLLKAEIQ
ncbi:MAG: hypothetical protein DI582_00770 [Azospirillum brasilense]|nr:MAG: hypothetical protein DI582_00770 [Azospirillum brasilense]